ncbi:MAG: type II toxin-antitoxin system RelE/ParE family toxin [Oscillospiraceae bacterium]|nr:type II toxin-antitoxin system RelE/ParE family toxin [Oscillospiraceae bacterium]
MFEVEFYETEDGKRPVEEFLDMLDNKMAAKLIGLMEILEEKGPELRMPYSEYLDDGIFELRCKLGSNITRALYFFYIGKKIVVTSGFVKKTQKTPPGELKLAKNRRADWVRRHQQK